MFFFCRWLQAAQNFREQQDKQENGQMRESYRVRLGEAKKINPLPQRVIEGPYMVFESAMLKSTH